MDDLELQTMLPEIVALGRLAGRAVMPWASAVVSDPSSIEIKDDGSPLTRADRASNEVIIEGLSKLTPDIALLSEECDDQQLSGKDAELYWCIDPLDGTKEFIKGLPDYTVNIALVETGIPVLGMVAAPAVETIYFACRGRGAQMIAGDCGARAIRARPASVRHSIGEVSPAHPLGPSSLSRSKKGSGGYTAVISRSHSSKETEKLLSKMGIGESIAKGSAIKLCAVAAGDADFYPRLGPTMLWDTAAGAAVAREAGCKVLGLDLEDLTYRPADGLKVEGFFVLPADNQEIFEKLRKAYR